MPFPVPEAEFRYGLTMLQKHGMKYWDDPRMSWIFTSTGSPATGRVVQPLNWPP